MTADEKEVRAAWEWLEVREQGVGSITKLQIVSDAFNVQEYPASRAWSVAAAYTRERKRQIAEVEEEITEIEFVSGFFEDERRACWQRILDRERAALAELRRGMRGE